MENEGPRDDRLSFERLLRPGGEHLRRDNRFQVGININEVDDEEAAFLSEYSEAAGIGFPIEGDLVGTTCHAETSDGIRCAGEVQTSASQSDGYGPGASCSGKRFAGTRVSESQDAFRGKGDGVGPLEQSHSDSSATRGPVLRNTTAAEQRQ